MRACQYRYLRSRVNFWSVDQSMRSIKYYSIKLNWVNSTLSVRLYIYITATIMLDWKKISLYSSRCWPNWPVWIFPATQTTVTRRWGHRLRRRLCRQIQRLGISLLVLWSWLVYNINITGAEHWDGGWGGGVKAKWDKFCKDS